MSAMKDQETQKFKKTDFQGSMDLNSEMNAIWRWWREGSWRVIYIIKAFFVW